MSEESTEWDESTAEDRVDREDTETIIEVLKRRGYTVICRTATDVERLAKVALLRELAAELRTGTGDLSDAIGDSGSFFGPKRYPEEILDERADQLEKGTPP